MSVHYSRQNIIRTLCTSLQNSLSSLFWLFITCAVVSSNATFMYHIHTTVWRYMQIFYQIRSEELKHPPVLNFTTIQIRWKSLSSSVKKLHLWSHWYNIKCHFLKKMSLTNFLYRKLFHLNHLLHHLLMLRGPLNGVEGSAVYWRDLVGKVKRYKFICQCCLDRNWLKTFLLAGDVW